MVQMVLETPVSVKTAEKFCQEILPEVSRTFAISIRFLPGTLGRAVLVAYLICRIADTIEDDPLASITAKTALLDHLLECFDSPSLANHYGHTARGVQGEAAHVRLRRKHQPCLCHVSEFAHSIPAACAAMGE